MLILTEVFRLVTWWFCVFSFLVGGGETSPNIPFQRMCMHPLQCRLRRRWNESSFATDRGSESWSANTYGGRCNKYICKSSKIGPSCSKSSINVPNQIRGSEIGRKRLILDGKGMCTDFYGYMSLKTSWRLYLHFALTRTWAEVDTLSFSKNSFNMVKGAIVLTLFAKISLDQRIHSLIKFFSLFLRSNRI